jgi:hypothetical protein
MQWDELKDLLAGPGGPWLCLLGLVVLSLVAGEGHRRLYTPIAFAWAAVIVARHFAFSVLDQYMLILAVYFGLYYGMPQSQTSDMSKPASPEALKTNQTS